MITKNFQLELNIPEGVQVTVDKGLFNVKGEKGEVSRNLFHPKINFKVENNKILFNVPKYTQNEKKLLFTYNAHLKNMFKGVISGITYKLKVCASHFPMSVTCNENKLEVKNFIGGKKPKILEIPKEVEVKVEGDVITLEGLDKELLGKVASRIEELCKRRGFDRRIFQDGIYIIEKDGKVMS